MKIIALTLAMAVGSIAKKSTFKQQVSSILNPDISKNINLRENKPNATENTLKIDAGLVTSFTAEFFNQHNQNIIDIFLLKMEEF